MHKSNNVHWMACKHVLKYPRGTSLLGNMYERGDDMKLEDYSDSDWA